MQVHSRGITAYRSAVDFIRLLPLFHCGGLQSSGQNLGGKAWTLSILALNPQMPLKVVIIGVSVISDHCDAAVNIMTSGGQAAAAHLFVDLARSVRVEELEHLVRHHGHLELRAPGRRRLGGHVDQGVTVAFLRRAEVENSITVRVLLSDGKRIHKT
jgi:hypothetical protein